MFISKSFNHQKVNRFTKWQLVILSNQQAKDSSFTLLQDKGKQHLLPIKKMEPLNIFETFFFK